jgi:hypothetical protein
MKSNAPKSGSTESNDLRRILPPILWRALARNGVLTFDQAKEIYPEQLMLMPHIGPRKFRLIEQALFPDCFYAPISGDEERDIHTAAKLGTVLRRAQGALHRHDLEMIERDEQP